MRRNEQMLLRKYQFNHDSFPTHKNRFFYNIILYSIKQHRDLHVRRARGYSSAVYRSENFQPKALYGPYSKCIHHLSYTVLSTIDMLSTEAAQCAHSQPRLQSDDYDSQMTGPLKRILDSWYIPYMWFTRRFANNSVNFCIGLIIALLGVVPIENKRVGQKR